MIDIQVRLWAHRWNTVLHLWYDWAHSLISRLSFTSVPFYLEIWYICVIARRWWRVFTHELAFIFMQISFFLDFAILGGSKCWWVERTPEIFFIHVEAGSYEQFAWDQVFWASVLRGEWAHFTGGVLMVSDCGQVLSILCVLCHMLQVLGRIGSLNNIGCTIINNTTC